MSEQHVSIEYYFCGCCLLYHFADDVEYGFHAMFRKGREQVLEYDVIEYEDELEKVA